MISPENPTDSDHPSRLGFFAGLRKTRRSLATGLSQLFQGSAKIDPQQLDDLEDLLILSDIGVQASQLIIDRAKVQFRNQKGSKNDIAELIRDELLRILKDSETVFAPQTSDAPFVILMVGINGTGKTTTVAKLAHYFREQGLSTMLAACDTYRAAAAEQLQTWGERLQVPVIASTATTDPAAIAHDSLISARANKTSVLIIDTAGRQHSRDDLMRQVNKISRVLEKLEPGAPHQTLITIDATTGQNAISQVEQFSKHVPLTGICVAKLDGTAKGGMIVALAEKFALPISFVGFGERPQDIAPFNRVDYINSLLSDARAHD